MRSVCEIVTEARRKGGAVVKQLSNQEISTILAALRLWQQESDEIQHFEEVDPLTNVEIDGLCEDLNCKDTFLVDQEESSLLEDAVQEVLQMHHALYPTCKEGCPACEILGRARALGVTTADWPRTNGKAVQL